MKVLDTEEEILETCYTLVLENGGEEYTVKMYSSDKNSYIDWYDKNWKMITQPDWADEIDLWELYNLESESK